MHDLSGRKVHRRAMLRMLAATWLLPTWPLAQAQTAPAQPALAAVINRVARFRALSQRMAKAYCQIFLDVLPKEALAVLASTRQLVRAGFDDLAKGQWSAEVTRQLAEVRKHSDALDALLVMPPTKESVVSVSVQADRMLAAANTATDAFEALSKGTSEGLMNTAGRQRMLSQRLAKNYFLSAAGLDGKSVRDQMALDALAFKQAMSSLAGAGVSSAGIRGELLSGEQQWVFFNAALERAPDARGLRAVATTSERLLEVMNSLTVQYETALKDARS